MSRDDNFSHDLKTLKRVVPYNDFMVLILDDRVDVWKGSKNLMYTKPYFFFDEKTIAEEGEFINVKCGQHDSFLYFITQNLQIIHATFYSLLDLESQKNEH